MTNEEAIKHLEFLKIAALIHAKPDRIDTEALDMAIKALEERPTGKWVEGYHDYFETLDCSLCGYVRNERHSKLNFCPNCGAKMKGAADEEEA